VIEQCPVGDNELTTTPSTDRTTRWGDDEMTMLCERCCVPIADGEPVVRYAHIDRAHPDGSISWIHSYVHTTGCALPRPAAHQRPDTGEWDGSRSIGVHRA